MFEYDLLVIELSYNFFPILWVCVKSIFGILEYNFSLGIFGPKSKDFGSFRVLVQPIFFEVKNHRNSLIFKNSLHQKVECAE